MKIKGFVAVFIVACGVVFLIWMARTGKEKTLKEAKAFDQTQRDLTIANMSALQGVIVSFIAQEGRTPNNLKELQTIHALIQASLDGWGTAIKYEKVSDENFRLISAGKDRTFGTSDDIIKDY